MRVFRSKLVYVAAVLGAMFIPLALTLGPVNLYVFIGSLLFAVSFAVVIAYWPALKLSLSLSIEDLDKVDLLTLAIILIFLATGLRESYVTFYREFFPLHPNAGRSDDYYLPLAFCRYLAFVGGVLALAARSERGELPVYKIPGWPWAVLSVIVGAVIGVVLVLLHP